MLLIKFQEYFEKMYSCSGAYTEVYKENFICKEKYGTFTK